MNMKEKANGLLAKLPFRALVALALIGTGCPTDGGGNGLTVTPPPQASDLKTLTLSGVAVNMRYVPAGSFQRDAVAANVSVITTGYWLAETETTQELFQAVMGSNPSRFSSNPATDEEQNKRPVEYVNWYHAIAFCNKLSLANGKQAVYSVKVSGTEVAWSSLTYAQIPTGSNNDWDGATMDTSKNGYRLPTEMEWMWAAMGADKTAQPNTSGYSKTYAGSEESGTTNIGNYAWYNGNSGSKTHEVGEKTANELGLKDMSGNVWEWCWDRYGGTNGSTGTVGETGELTDYPGAVSGSMRVRRGGSWYEDASYCTAATRYAYSPAAANNRLGFRFACDNGTRLTVTAAGGVTSVAKGGTLQFSVSPRESVTWSITTSGVAAGTSISATGLLTVAEDETKSSLGIKAVSAADTTRIGTATVTASNPAAGESKTLTLNGVSVNMRYVPAGRFRRDVTEGSVSVITKGYWLAETETTQELFQAVIGDNPSRFTGSPADGETQNKRPVEQVNWYHAIAFCNKLSLANGKQAVYSVKESGTEVDWANLTYARIPISSNLYWNAATMDTSKNGYRLPTEMEWMWAAMGAGIHEANNIDDYAWYRDNSNDKTHEVGKKAANELGLKDMSGNVIEWCWDWYGSYPADEQTDFTGADSGSDRVERGGSWYGDASYCTADSRYFSSPTTQGGALGFRFACRQ